MHVDTQPPNMTPQIHLTPSPPHPPDLHWSEGSRTKEKAFLMVFLECCFHLVVIEEIALLESQQLYFSKSRFKVIFIH